MKLLLFFAFYLGKDIFGPINTGVTATPPMPPLPQSSPGKPCTVIEEKSQSEKKCQFPFIFKGRLFSACTTVTGTNDEGEYEHGTPWCSTKTDDNNNHISGQGVYGDCVEDSACPIEPSDSIPMMVSLNDWDEDGNYIMGDMILTEGQYEQSYGEGKIQNGGIAGEGYRWPSGEGVKAVIPYDMSKVSWSDKSKVRNAVNKFNNEMSGCIKIRERTSRDENYVDIDRNPGNGCRSNVGRISWMKSQHLNLAPGCYTDGTIIHEFIHALGFHHEQTRRDRDQYVTVDEQGIRRKLGDRFYEANYGIKKDSLRYGVPYDGKSLMHYSAQDLGNGRKSMTSRMPDISTNELGSHGGWMSNYDKLKLRKMYGCTGSDPSPTDPSQDCKTNYGVDCVFPFKYGGRTYYECTKDYSSTYWCATKVGRNNQVIPGQWGACKVGCPGLGSGGGATCAPDQFKCRSGKCKWRYSPYCSGQCIPKWWQYDGEADCTDGSDE